jgi:hypothetical protein
MIINSQKPLFKTGTRTNRFHLNLNARLKTALCLTTVLRIPIGFNADPDPGSRPMRSLRIRILIRLCRHKKLDFDMKNTLYVGNSNTNTECH